MSMNYGDEYTLGDEITEAALGKRGKETVVVSVRLTAGEFARIEKICSETGRSMSQTIRDALAAYQGTESWSPSLFRMTLLNSEGISVSIGPREITSPSCYGVMQGLTGSNQLSGISRRPSEMDTTRVDTLSPA